MHAKKISLSFFNNKKAILFNPHGNIIVDIKPAYEVIDKISFCNVSDKDMAINDINFEVLKDLVSQNGGFKSQLEFFIKNEFISYYFIGKDRAEPNGPLRFYGYNNIQWEPQNKMIYIASCEADPFDEKLLFDLGDNRYKGIAFYTVAQSSYFYTRLISGQPDQDWTIHLQSSYFAVKHKIYERYGFQLSEGAKQSLLNRPEEELAKDFYTMFLSVENLHEFVRKNNLVFSLFD